MFCEACKTTLLFIENRNRVTSKTVLEEVVMERRNKNYLMAGCKIVSGVICMISFILPYGVLYEAAWVHYRGLRFFEFGGIGVAIGTLVLVCGVYDLFGYACYLLAPKIFFVGGRPISKEKAEKVVKNGKVSVTKIKFRHFREIGVYIFLVILNLLLNAKGVSWGDVWFDSYGPAWYLIFLAAGISILGSVLGILMADMQAADELDWWTAVYEGRVDASGAFVDTLKKAAAGTGRNRAVIFSDKAGPVAEQKASSEKARPVTEQKISYCPQCGAQCVPGALFCIKCGEKLED